MEKNRNPLKTDIASEFASYDVPLFKSEMCSEFYISCVHIGAQAVKVEPGMSAPLVAQDQSEGCSSESQSTCSQDVKTEPYDRDQDEEIFSLAGLTGYFQSSSLTQCSPDEKDNQSFNQTTTEGCEHFSKGCNCDQCNKSFSQSRNLISHKRTHTGYKPYNCDTCYTNEMCSEFAVSSVPIGAPAVKVEPEMSALFLAQDQSAGCTSEPQSSQAVKTEPYDRDQDEERFSLAGLTGHFQSSSLTLCSRDEKEYQSFNQTGAEGCEHKSKRSNCDQMCDKSISKSGKLVAHKRTLTGDKPYNFDQCNKIEMCNEFGISGVHIGAQAVKVEPGMCAPFLAQDQSANCLGELRSSQAVKIEPYDQDQDEESFSLAVPTARFQSSSLTQCSRGENDDQSFNQTATEGCECSSKGSNCDQCNKSFSQSGNLVSHKRTHTGDKPYNYDPCNKSGMCSEFGISSVPIGSQVVKVKLGMSALFLDQSASSSEPQSSQAVNTEPYDHGQNEEQTPSVTLCSRDDKDNQSFNETVAEGCEHSTPPSLEKVENSNSRDQYKMSFSQFWNLNAQKLAYTARTGDKPFRCDQCNKSFKRRSELVSHRRVHTGEKPYSCDQCNKSFKRPQSLVLHKRTHAVGNSSICDQCNKSFSQPGHLVAHKRTHTGEKPYSCDQCKKSFRTSGSLNEHKRTCTDGNPSCCDQCEQSFSQSESLVAHERTHAGEKPCSCDQRSKSFNQTGAEGCEHCSQSFNPPSPEKVENSNNCNQHKMSFSQFWNLNAHKLAYTARTTDKPFICDQCNKSFRRRSTLLVHRQRIHTRNCKLCNKSFIISGNLVLPKRTHTGEKPYN